ncbi:MAG: hypothetical protein AB7S93_20230 [Xanthobacteraceae bacterium]
MTAAEKMRAYRARKAAKAFGNTEPVTKPMTTTPGAAEVADLLKALRTVLKEIDHALATPGSKQALRAAVEWQISRMMTLIESWPKASPGQKQWGADARNADQMFTMGACEGSRAAHFEMMKSKIADNPNWPGPNPSR